MEEQLEFRKGTGQDLDELEQLYVEVIDYLDSHTNYPCWVKGVYPNRDSAVEGIEEDSLFVACADGRIVGTVILRQKQEPAYEQVDWHMELDEKDIFVIHTLAIHPDYMHQGMGKRLMETVLSYAEEMGIKAVRLDVVCDNIPAIRLYEKCGFEYIDTVDLGLGEYGLDWFKLYERLV